MKQIRNVIILVFIISACGQQNNKFHSNDTTNEPTSITNDNMDTYSEDKTSTTSDSTKITLSKYTIIDESIKYILDNVIKEYNECQRSDSDYHFSIAIQNAEIIDSSEIKKVYIARQNNETNIPSHTKSLYISRSFYKDFISRGYGFFYYKGYLFVLEGVQLDDIFRETKHIDVFEYKQEPITTFDPPRWLYYYSHNKYYFAHSSPCGG